LLTYASHKIVWNDKNAISDILHIALLSRIKEDARVFQGVKTPLTVEKVIVKLTRSKVANIIKEINEKG